MQAGQTFDVPHVYKNKSGATFDAPSAFTTEAVAAHYSNIGVQDGTPSSYTTTANGYYMQALFTFDLLNDLKIQGRIPKSWTVDTLKANIKSLTATWVGYGVGANGGAPANGATAKLLNGISMTWEATGGSNTATSPSAIVRTTGTPASWIDSNGFAYLLAHSTYASDGTNPSTIYTDYVKVDVSLYVEYPLDGYRRDSNGRLAMLVDQRKAAVSYANYDQTLNVAASGTATVTITPPAGELWRVKSLYLNIPAPSGATAGTHGLRVATANINGGRNWSLYGDNTYSAQVRFGMGYWQYASGTVQPTQEISQMTAMLALTATAASPLIVYYVNNTTGGTQIGTLAITIVREVEYIA